MLFGFLDVFDGDEALQFVIFVDDNDALETVLVHQAFGFVERVAFFDDDEAIARCHFF